MKSISVAAAALLAAPALAQFGQAIVKNECNNAVYLWNTPSAGGGGSEVDQQIAAGSQYAQTYQPLTNNNGWSLKVAPTNNQGTVVQFEYTVQSGNSGTLWYDISAVNGDPFDGNWYISSNNADCQPKQTSYRYPTDNANGMQAGCTTDASITLTLCSGGSGGGSSTEPESSSSVAAPAPTKVKPAPPPAPSTTLITTHSKPPKPIAAQADVVDSDAILTKLVTQVVTVEVTATGRPKHHPRATKREIHQHQHHAMHHHHM